MMTKILTKLFVVASLAAMSGFQLSAHDDKPAKPDRSPKNIGNVLVFGGTGWYRHPETAAISGWLARLSDELGMQVDCTESPKDIQQLLDHYDVLILNNSNELVKLFDEAQRKKIEDWYNAGGGIVALHAALVRQTEWEWLT
ncbi:MAG: ThuA domain-containing protein, partial [Verrucomicrobiota bacterium]